MKFTILHIAYSQYRAIPAIDIDIRISGLATSRAVLHLSAMTMQCMQSLYLARRRPRLPLVGENG